MDCFCSSFFRSAEGCFNYSGIPFRFITGIVSYIGIIYWIASVVTNYGYLPLYLGIILMLLLACYLSVYVACLPGDCLFPWKSCPLFSGAGFVGLLGVL